MNLTATTLQKLTSSFPLNRRNGPGGLAAFCSGFSDFAQSGVNTGTMEATGTVDPTDPTDTADNTDASTATPTS